MKLGFASDWVGCSLARRCLAIWLFLFRREPPHKLLDMSPKPNSDVQRVQPLNNQRPCLILQCWSVKRFERKHENTVHGRYGCFVRPGCSKERYIIEISRSFKGIFQGNAFLFLCPLLDLLRTQAEIPTSLVTLGAPSYEHGDINRVVPNLRILRPRY